LQAPHSQRIRNTGPRGVNGNVALRMPRQRELARTSDPYAPQECVIYFILARDPWYGLPGRDKPTIVVYVGETIRASIDRILEHFKDKWWARDIRGYHVLSDEATGSRWCSPARRRCGRRSGG
jgi:hypothetical protein